MKTVKIGETTIDTVVELGHKWFDATWLYPSVTDEMIQRNKDWINEMWLDPVNHKVALSFHSFLIRTPNMNIIVDTCNGNHKDRLPKHPWFNALASTNYMDSLASHGLKPEDINVVLCTHLHTDHVGWNTQLINGEWVPTFPNARYVWAKQEFDYLYEQYKKNPDIPLASGSFNDSVMPVVEAGQVDLVDINHTVDTHLDDKVWFEAATGHTKGHIAIHVKGNDGHAIMTGDIFHHPLIFDEPNLSSLADYDPEELLKTRLRIMDTCCGSDTLLMTGHFPTPVAGRLYDNKGKIRFRYCEAV